MAWLTDEVREHAALVAAQARSVRIDDDALAALGAGAQALGEPAHDPQRTYTDGEPEDVARYFLTWNAINFGSGWFPTLRKRAGCSGATTLAWAWADRFRARGAPANAELRATSTPALAAILGQRADHELLALQAQALRALGTWLGDRDALDVVAAAGGDAERFAESLSTGMATWADRGFHKRSQLCASDLATAGVGDFTERSLDRLTLFADNLVPHVLRCEGALAYAPVLAEHIERGDTIPSGPWERELRGCAVEAVERLSTATGVPPRRLDGWLWHRGQAPEYKARPRHRAKSIWY